MFYLYMYGDFMVMMGESIDGDIPNDNDPRIAEFREIEKRIESLSVESHSIVIEDAALYQLFGKIRKSALEGTLDDDGGVIEDALFDKLKWEYHPEKFAKRMLQVRPLVSLTPVPADVIDLLTEARKAYCLRLPTACISVCRSTVERAVLDIAVRIGRINSSDAPEELRMCAKISALIDADLTRLSPLRREIDEFLADTSRVIHSSIKGDEPEALRLYLQALKLIGELYGRYSKQFAQ